MMTIPPESSQWAQSHKVFSDRVGFLDLPREIRDLCYDFGMRVHGAIYIYTPDIHLYRPILRGRIVKYKNEGPPEPERVDVAVPISLLRTCRQVYVESVEVLYRENVFSLYSSRIDFASAYSTFLRHIIFTMEAGQGIFSEDLEVMSYWWRRVLWPDIINRSTKLLDRYPGLETLTFPIKSGRVGQTWRPAFLAVEQRTKEQRVAFAARWLRNNCPMGSDRIRRVIHLEIASSTELSRNDFKGSRFSFDDDEDGWDPSELEEAFQLMKSFQ